MVDRDALFEDGMTLDEAIQRLADFTRSLPDFRIYKEHEIDKYDHMGAAIADAVLQAQRDYYSVVAPRTERILRQWPEAKTVSAVLECLQSVSASEFLDWKDTAASGNYLAHRVERFCEILKLFHENGIETLTDLRTWLSAPANSDRLSAIYGVGPKTTEYMKILVGLQTAAPDTRLYDYLAKAGIDAVRDGIAREIINRTADLLSIPRSCFDHSIWQYMGAHGAKRAGAC